RFLMRIQLGYPDPRAERELLTGKDRRQMLTLLPALADAERLQGWQEQILTIHLSDAVIDYLQRLVIHTRQSRDFPHGLSPRGLLALKRATQAWAFIEGRNYAIPEDVQAVLPAVAEHRLRGSMEDQQKMHSLTSQLLNAVDVIE
ncbi:MAG TPA: MoxR family ATPase, partial [Agitococcus sp.]|nr:MoxR family ATPase [Agitococcus sp.]